MLSQRSLNYFQRWALVYWVYMDRRTAVQDRQVDLEMQTFNLFPERWESLYKDQVLSRLAEESEEEPVTDLEMLDRFYEQQSAAHDKEWATPPTWPGGGGEYHQDWSPWV